MSKYIFEISWEIANKVGGIYTVLSSKAKYLKDFYGKNYFVIGPYLGVKSQGDFRILQAPKEFEEIIDNLQKQGIIVYYGEWLVEGYPQGFFLQPYGHLLTIFPKNNFFLDEQCLKDDELLHSFLF
jgi:hypothetical protein